MKKHFLIIVLILIIISSCTKNNVNSSPDSNNNTTCTGTKSFATDVKPIFQNVCANSGCHDASSTNGPGPLTTYQQIFDARSDIRSAVASGIMPKNSTLSAGQKVAIICWIDNGAANN